MKKINVPYLGMVLVLAAFLAGCGTYRTHEKFAVGPIDLEPTKTMDVNGKVRYESPKASVADLIGVGDVRFGQRSMQGAGTLTTPASQVVIQEKRTVKVETYADTRGCPLKEQIKEVKTGEEKKTETYTRVENHPSTTVGLSTNLQADDGPGTKLTGKTIDTAGNLGSSALLGISFPKNKGDNITQNAPVGTNSTAATGPSTNNNFNGNWNNPTAISGSASSANVGPVTTTSGAAATIH